MKKASNFLPLLCGMLLSMQLMAQTEGAMIKEADWELINSSGLVNSINGTGMNDNLLKLDNGITVALIKNSKEEFAVAAIATDMSFKWRTSLPGIPFSLSRFKGKLLVTAAKSKSFFKSFENNYVAFLIDPANGNLLLQKDIYNGSEEYMEFPNFYISESGDYFKFSVRQTSVKRKVQVALPGLASLITLKGIDNKFGETRSFSIYTLDEQLDTTQLKPLLQPGIFAGAISNSQGDVFVLTLKDRNSIVVARYPESKTETVKVIEQPLDTQLKGFFFNQNLIENFYYTDSRIKPERVYWSVMIDEGKGTTLYVSQLDFSSGNYKLQKELFTRDTFKQLAKSYINVNKKVDGPALGAASNLFVNSISEMGNKIVVGTGGIGRVSGQYATTLWHRSEILNVFDTNLDLLYRQIIPRNFPKINVLDFSRIAYNYLPEKQQLRFVCNTFEGMNSNVALYGEIDMNNGKILKLNHLEKNKVGKRAYINGVSVLWNNKGFIIPYFDPKGMTGTKYDIFVKEYVY